MTAPAAQPDHEREGSLLNAVLELPAAERVAFLDRTCAADPALRQRLENLLKAHAGAADFLEDGAAPGLVAALRPTELMPAAEEVPERIGRYRLVEKLGEGGFGAVHLQPAVRG